MGRRKYLILILLVIFLIPVGVSGAYVTEFLRPGWSRAVTGCGEVYDNGTFSFYWSGIGTVKIVGTGGISAEVDDQLRVVTSYGTLDFICPGRCVYVGQADITSICRPGYNTIHLYCIDIWCGIIGYGNTPKPLYIYYDKSYGDSLSISGTVYNQSSGSILSGASVYLDMGGHDTYSTTTDGSGFYYIGNISAPWDLSREMTVTASMTGYQSQIKSTVALYDSAYTMDFRLSPSSPPHNTTAVYIVALDNATMQPLNNTYVFINSEVYNTGSLGNVLVEDLDAETEYGYTAYCINYVDELDTVTTAEEGNVTVDYVILDRNYSYSVLFGYVHNAFTGVIIPSVGVSVNQSGYTRTTTSDTAGFYAVLDLDEYIDMQVNASKTGFINNSYTVEGRPYGLYLFNMSLVPLANISYTGTALTGVVFNTLTGDSVSGAAVRCYNGTWTSTYNITTSGGIYLFNNLSADSNYSVEASMMAYKTNTVTARTGAASSITSYAVGLEPVGLPGDGMLFYGWVYNITDSSDLVNGAMITCSQADLGTSVTTITNESGFYMLSGVENTSYVNVSCTHASYQTYLKNFTQSQLDGNTYMNLNIPMYPVGYVPSDIDGSWVAGIALDAATGQEVSGAAVRCYNGTWTSGYNYTSASGFFVVDELLNGSSYTVEGNKYGYMVNTTSATIPSDLGNGTYVLLSMDRSYIELFGRIYDVTNFSPISGVHIDTKQGSRWINLTTNSTGGFYSNSFEPGVRMDIYIWKTGYYPENVSYTPPVNDRANLTLGLYLVPEGMSHIGPAIFGTVLNSVNLSPISGCSVRSTATTSGNVSTNLTNDLGFFMLEELDAYAYHDIIFEKDGYADTSGTFTTYGSETLINAGTVYMVPEGYAGSNVTLFGYVKNVWTGQVISEVNVSVSQNGGINYTLTDLNGRYVFYNLSTDFEAAITTNKSGYFEDSHEFTPYENGEYQLDFWLIPNGENEDDYLYQGVNISGYLYNAYDNATRIGAAIVGIMQDTTSYNTTTNETGDYSATGMVKNIYINFDLEHPLYYNYSIPFLPKHNGTYYGNFPMVPNGLIMDDINYSAVNINGYVRNAINLSEIASCNVNTTQNTTTYNSTTNASGGFEIAGYIKNEEISMLFNVSGYHDSLYTFTPNHNGTYTGDFYMIPDDFSGYNMTGATSAMIGFVYNASTGDAIAGASVKCYNMTWVSDYNTTTTSGFFMFDNLEPSSTYGVEASKTGYYNYTNSSVSIPAADNYTIVYLPLSTVYPFEVFNGTVVYGIAYDASTGLPLSGATVTLSNGTNTSVNITPLTGLYVFDELLPLSSYSISGSLSGYNNATVSFTSGDVDNYTNQNLPMEPIDTIPHNGTTIMGIVYALPFYEAVGNATTQLYNSTWSDTNYSSDRGFFMFDDLSALTQYMLTGSKTNYGVDAKSVTTGTRNTTTVAFLYLDKYYNVNISFINAYTLSYITDQIYILVDSVASYNTTLGFVNIPVNYGRHTFDISTENYRSQSTTDVIYADGNITFYLVAVTSEAGSGTRYPPITVELQFVDQYFKPITGLYVVANPVNTTTGGNWSALKEVYGVQDLQYYNPENISSGFTDSNGLIIFPSLKPVYYSLSATGTHTSGESVSYSGFMMAGEDRKVIMVRVGEPEPIGRERELTYNVTGYYINTTAYTVNITYHNVGENTTWIRGFVEYRNGTAINEFTDTDTSNMTYSYTFIPVGGTDYTYGMEVMHTGYDNFTVKKSFTADFPISIPGMNSERMKWMAMGLLVLCGAIFSAYSVRFGAIVIPAMAAFFVGLKWMTVGIETGLIIASLMIIAVLTYIRKSEAKL